jgi:hypothetical protein
MKLRAYIAALHAALFAILLAVSPAGSGSMTLLGAGKPAAAAGGCAEATALIARMDGAQNTSAVTTMICGMVTDGTYSKLDGLYVFATNSTGNATLNWAQNAFNLTWTSLVNCTLAANSGITGDGSTCFADTGFTPSTASGKWALSSITLGTCVVNSRAVNQAYVSIGATTGGALFSYQQPLSSGAFFYDLGSTTFPSYAGAGNAQGSWISTRTSNSAITLYLNGTSVATPADAEAGLSTSSIYVFGLDNSGFINSPSADKLAYAFFGSGMNATQVGNMRTRLNTYIAAVGGSGC